MSSGRANISGTDFKALTGEVLDRLGKNLPNRRELPGGGRLRIDRQLPFLCLTRPRAEDDQGTKDLVTSEASYLQAPANPSFDPQVVELCRHIGCALREHFGVFLFVEVWSASDENAFANSSQLTPGFVVVAPETDRLSSTAETLGNLLRQVTVDGRHAEVEVQTASPVGPQAFPLLSIGSDRDVPDDCTVLGLCVKPIYRDPVTGDVFPGVLQQLRGQLAHAIRKTVAEFTGAHSSSQFRRAHYQAHYHLGPDSMSPIAGLVDQELCEVSESFDFLIQSTPANAEQAWEEFRANRFAREPEFIYPQLPFHVSLVKRRLFAIEIERVEDPSLAHLFYEKQAEIDLELTALSHLGQPEFLQSSVQLYGHVDEELADLAGAILERYPGPTGDPRSDAVVGLDEVVRAAREELVSYHRRLPEFNATVEVCDQLASGLMVSRHRLLLSKSLELPASRVDPLLHHEVGTHLLTYFNGRCQPLRQLYAGLAGYEELQEGLAVLAEYLTGGLTVDRLRTLAGRVVAARQLLGQSSFVETFTLLRDEYRFSPRESFSTTLRAYRGGGSTKDIIYLRGLSDLVSFLSEGHDIEPLYVGKLGLQHVPSIQELRRRGILNAPALLPRFWTMDGTQDRLARVRTQSLLELMEACR